MSRNIHKTAIVETENIPSNIEIGAYSVVGKDVVLAEGIKIHSHVVVEGKTNIGENTEIFPFASIGTIPQDLKYHGEESRLEIGKNNKIREHVTINTGTEGGGHLTKIGNGCLFMVASHIAHDCVVGDNVILANNATLAGHVVVEDYVVIGGLSALHQFVRVGKCAMIGGMSGVENDVIPYGLVMGERANLSGLNLVGLKRRDFLKDEINALRKIYKILFTNKIKEDSFEKKILFVKEEFSDQKLVQDLLQFITQKRDRGICMPH